MNFYMRYLQQPTSPRGRPSCDYHFFKTYFYTKLKDAVLNKWADKEKSFAKIRGWWKGVNIFEKPYILLPIHENAHWSLVIICMPDKEEELGPIILHLDSLGLHDSTSIFVNIKSFLKEEWNYLKGETPSELPIADRIWQNLPRRIDVKIIEVPQQTNGYDCGLFVLSFMERFIEEAPKRLKKKDYTMFGRQWFRPQEASDLRQKIRSLLVQEFKREPHNAKMEQQIRTYVRKRKRPHGVVGAEEAVDDPDTVNSPPEATLMEPAEQQNKRNLRSNIRGSKCKRYKLPDLRQKVGKEESFSLSNNKRSFNDRSSVLAQDFPPLQKIHLPSDSTFTPSTQKQKVRKKGGQSSLQKQKQMQEAAIRDFNARYSKV
ncbi:hypothetical protein LguiB_012362 [Lonicera macranthoides]